ncbi:hypothetical protein Tsubulata_005671 [Turnera subulata]|uniref:Xylanase inhibitor N-terminal domain-containing protein n=1 Tax=Turnera subulata TaxID=218843 RepID=A0A9Q0J4V2_9ROSI|nr:hypothetical protein Tsubulata_005671 [Turnera subulata]
MVMDTGSSLVWFPCTSRYRCSNCNFPNVTPILTFIPNLSSTSKLVGCKNPRCSMLLGPSVLSSCKETCDPPTSQNYTTSTCPPYIIHYGSGATSGLLLTETLHLPHNKNLPDFLVGCSILSIRQPEGIAGFGRSPESLPSQLGAKKFSYCLVSHRFDDNPEASSHLVHETGSGSGGDAMIPSRKVALPLSPGNPSSGGKVRQSGGHHYGIGSVLYRPVIVSVGIACGVPLYFSGVGWDSSYVADYGIFRLWLLGFLLRVGVLGLEARREPAHRRGGGGGGGGVGGKGCLGIGWLGIVKDEDLVFSSSSLIFSPRLGDVSTSFSLEWSWDVGL